VPSIMELLGRANWWMPAWLDRHYPHLGAEPQVPAPALAEPQPSDRQPVAATVD
jgi:putative drug exporter of the RND superfamily